MNRNSLIFHGVNLKFTFKSAPKKIVPNPLFQSLLFALPAS